MKLYRIILVDDEEEVRKSIIKKIDWEQAGFEVVGDAENGEDALEKIELLEPDVVLTDIKMPYMDGLTLTERIRTKYPSMKVLIFSGFDDFEYAKRAIKLNVTEYILKPVNVEELTAILMRIKGNLDEEIEQKRNVNLLRESYRNSFPIIREHFLNSFVRGELDEETVRARLCEYEIPVLNGESWSAAVIGIEPETTFEKDLSIHKEKELIPISVKKIVEETIREYCSYVLFDTTEEMVLIAALKGTDSLTGLIDLLGDICRETRRILGVTITIGVGQTCSNLTEIGTSYQNAVAAGGYKAIVGAGSVIFIHDMEPVNRGKLQFGGKEEAELISGVKFGPKEKIDEAIGCLIGKMEESKVHFHQYQAYMLGAVNCLIQLIQQYDLELGEMFGSEYDYLKIINNITKRDETAVWLKEVTYRMNDAMNLERDNMTKNVIREAEQFIQDHYQNPDLSVEVLCRHLHMSPAYFSTMFKRETGQAYTAYLTELRLNKAVELLNKTDDKTYVIAAKVGYPEQNYFSYVFKKRFGISPTKYRGTK